MILSCVHFITEMVTAVDKYKIVHHYTNSQLSKTFLSLHIIKEENNLNSSSNTHRNMHTHRHRHNQTEKEVFKLEMFLFKSNPMP